MEEKEKERKVIGCLETELRGLLESRDPSSFIPLNFDRLGRFESLGNTDRKMYELLKDTEKRVIETIKTECCINKSYLIKVEKYEDQEQKSEKLPRYRVTILEESWQNK